MAFERRASKRQSGHAYVKAGLRAGRSVQNRGILRIQAPDAVRTDVMGELRVRMFFEKTFDRIPNILFVADSFADGTDRKEPAQRSDLGQGLQQIMLDHFALGDVGEAHGHPFDGMAAIVVNRRGFEQIPLIRTLHRGLDFLAIIRQRSVQYGIKLVRRPSVGLRQGVKNLHEADADPFERFGNACIDRILDPVSVDGDNAAIGIDDRDGLLERIDDFGKSEACFRQLRSLPLFVLDVLDRRYGVLVQVCLTGSSHGMFEDCLNKGINLFLQLLLCYNYCSIKKSIYFFTSFCKRKITKIRRHKNYRKAV